MNMHNLTPQDLKIAQDASAKALISLRTNPHATFVDVLNLVSYVATAIKISAIVNDRYDPGTAEWKPQHIEFTINFRGGEYEARALVQDSEHVRMYIASVHAITQLNVFGIVSEFHIRNATPQESKEFTEQVMPQTLNIGKNSLH